MKILSKILLVAYILTLLWLVLFKFSFDLPGVLDYQQRSLNLVPFVDYFRGNVRETIDNFVVFVPFGLLLGVTYKQISLKRKLASIFVFSLVVEAAQYALAIGTTDVTDIITNTLGGLFGLALYDLAKRYASGKWLDRIIVVIGSVLLVSLLLYRILVIHVRY